MVITRQNQFRVFQSWVEEHQVLINSVFPSPVAYYMCVCVHMHVRVYKSYCRASPSLPERLFPGTCNMVLHYSTGQLPSSSLENSRIS